MVGQFTLLLFMLNLRLKHGLCLLCMPCFPASVLSQHPSANLLPATIEKILFNHYMLYLDMHLANG